MPALVIYGGGPTAVWNETLAGLVDLWTAKTRDPIWGARKGLDGVLGEEFVDLSAQPAELWPRLAATSGSVLGTSRRQWSTAELIRALGVFERYGIHTVLFSGGNGSIATAGRVAEFAGGLRVLAVPATVANDVAGTHATPGYGSCARLFAHALRGAGADSPVVVIETPGRDAGWMAAATALARVEEDDPPHRIYFPERPVAPDRICAEVKALAAELGQVVIAVSESLGADAIAAAISAKTGLAARVDRPGRIGRADIAWLSARDRADARRVGEAAAHAALEGARGVMVALTAVESTLLVSLDEVAGKTRVLPEEFIDASGGDVTPGFLDYARPLAGVIAAPERLVHAPVARRP